MRPAWALAAAILAGCAATTPPPTSPAADSASACAVKATFGSYAMGVDRELASEIQKTIDADKRVANVTRRPWGREGEFDLCLTLRPGAPAQEVFQALGAKLQGRGDKAPTSITLQSGETISTPPRP